MKRTLMTLAAAAMLTAHAPMIGAQAPAPGEPAATPTVNLTQEQRHVIKEYIKDMNVERAPEDVKVEVGATVPGGVKQHQFPSPVFQKVPQVRNHTFFLKDDRVVVVSPRDNTVAEVIE